MGCAKSYLSAIENERRDNPPSAEIVRKLEGALGLREGLLLETARWQSTPEEVRRTVAALRDGQRAARRLAELLSRAEPRREDGSTGGGNTGGTPVPPEAGKEDTAGPAVPPGGVSIDELYRSGELRELIDRIAPPGGGDEDGGGGGAGIDPIGRVLPLEVPLINSVAAGYPAEFTDLGYPARVADEYVRCADVGDADAFAARVVGDSMQPEYREGDVVVFSPARQVASGMDCFVRLEPDHESTFKRVYFDRGPEGEELIRLQPLNSAYAPAVMARERVAGLYAAVSVTRAL